MRKNGKYNKLGDCKGTSYTVKVSSVGTDSVKLSWTKIGCTNYRIYQNIKGEWKEIGKTTGTSYTVKKLAPATKYQFKIRACKQDDKKTNNNHYGKYSGVVTATTKKSDKITQADIDAMKAELTAYSRDKAEYIKEHYTEFWKYGIDYNTLEEYFSMVERKVSPQSSSYDRVDTISFTEGSDFCNKFLSMYKEYIDYECKKRDDVYYVVYIESCPNGLDVNSDPCWAVYLLY